MQAIQEMKSAGFPTGICHICNSSAFFKYPQMYLDAVRIGSAFSGRLQIAEPTGLQRVGYLASQICEIKQLKKGDKVGYSGTYQAKKDRKVAIVQVGYSDGIWTNGPRDSVRMIDKLRALKQSVFAFLKNGTRYATIEGKRYPILGRIGMKNLIMDITGTNIEIGDEVTFDVNLVLSNQKIKRMWE